MDFIWSKQIAILPIFQILIQEKLLKNKIVILIRTCRIIEFIVQKKRFYCFEKMSKISKFRARIFDALFNFSFLTGFEVNNKCQCIPNPSLLYLLVPFIFHNKMHEGQFLIKNCLKSVFKCPISRGWTTNFFLFNKKLFDPIQTFRY